MPHGLTDWLSGGYGPQFEGRVIAAGHCRLPVGAERGYPNFTPMAKHAADRPAAFGVPEPRRVVVAGTQDIAAIGAHRDRTYCFTVLALPARRAALDIPQKHAIFGIPKPGDDMFT